ncbi:MAG: bifunctional folylpolyglutamate synthase/dihydrofolate synthase [Deltaproteobacteria bacterium]|nr:bifunctional folylpolyglutamate synthase/dihydrofolate synthase [Deltaproteobacteria bacterium]
MVHYDPLEYLTHLKSKGINLDLGPVTRLLRSLGNPHKNYRTVLIGGSNGKGSVAAIISSILTRGGFTVGLYTSPHLVDFRERIRINNRLIEQEDLLQLIDQVRNVVTEDVTYFEFATAIAFVHFYRCRVDLAILEVGMGGRLDATNVVDPEVSVITNVSLEHQRYLGRNLNSIAREKGGIIKRNGICLTAAKQTTVIKMLEHICSTRQSRLYRLGKEIRIRRSKGETFSYDGISKTYKNLSVPLMGRHQIDNAALALAALELLEDTGYSIAEETIVHGLREVRWEGRLEVLNDNPRLVVDGAHNPAAISVLYRTLKDDFTYDRLILIFGVLKDKNYRAMLRRLAPLADEIIVTGPREERALQPDALRPVAHYYNRNVEVIDDSRKALLTAVRRARTHDLICVTGSLYLVGEIKQALDVLS